MIRFTAALVLLAATPVAHAIDPLSYSFWDAQYLNSTVESTDPASTPSSSEDDVEGVRAVLSVGLHRYMNFVGEFDQRRYADSRDGFISAGFGTHTQHPDYQLFGSVTYERLELDNNNPPPSTDESREGYGVQLGVRARLPDVELHASYRYLDLSDGDDEEVTGGRYGAGMAVQLSPWWALVADYNVRSLETETAAAPDQALETEYNEWSVGFRRYFATDTDRRARKGGLLTGDDAAAE